MDGFVPLSCNAYLCEVLRSGSAPWPRHVLRDLLKAGVKRLRANLHEHVAHVLDQDKLRVITRGFEIPEELDRLGLANFRVVDTLNKEDGRRVRRDEMRGAGKSQVRVITGAEDLLNAGGRSEAWSGALPSWASRI